MINTRKIGGGYCIYSAQPQKIWEGGKALSSCSPIRLPKGGQRWDNTSEIGGGVING